MAKSDANLHRIDLLLTLDYLLNHTDENHPATQIKICEYARKFGLKYDKKNTTGNDVDRRRISASLEFLHTLTNSNQADKIPFKVEKTEGGKYFVSSKFSIEKEEIIKILSSLQNDKYIKKQETDTLIEKLLNIFVNEQSREEYKKELSINDREVRKINPTFNRKMRLVNKAYKEGKMIKIGHKIYVDNKNFKEFEFYYRVYMIKDFKNKPYALLLPIDTGDFVFYRDYIFEPIEKLSIPIKADREVLMDDFEDNRDLDSLFKEKCPWLESIYGTPQAMLERTKMPVDKDGPFLTCFYFRAALYKFIKPSFEEFFNCELECVGCKTFKTYSFNELRGKDDKRAIVPDPLIQGESPDFYVANITVSRSAFQSWLLTDIHGDGLTNISDLVTLVEPAVINRNLYYFYKRHFEKFEIIHNSFVSNNKVKN